MPKATLGLFDRLKHFHAYEFGRHATEMDAEFLERLHAVRLETGIPFIFTSSYRPGDKKCHGTGYAVDIACANSHHRYVMLAAFLRAGFKRIGVYDKHLHVDSCSGSKFPENVIWWGVSQ